MLPCCRAHTAGQVSCVRRSVLDAAAAPEMNCATAGDDWHWNVGDEDAAEATARREKEKELASARKQTCWSLAVGLTPEQVPKVTNG